MKTIASRTARCLCTASLLALAAAAGSCAQEYANYPPITGDDFAAKNVNSPNMRNAMAAALRWTVLRYPPPGGTGPGTFAINLPAGTTEDTYDFVARTVGNGAVPVTAENASQIPVYHITRVWLRGSIARIDVVRPVFEVEQKPRGGSVYRGAEIRLAGGWDPWHVTGSSEYEIGVLEPPALHLFGETHETRSGTPSAAPASSPSMDPEPAPYGAPAEQQVAPAEPQ